MITGSVLNPGYGQVGGLGAVIANRSAPVSTNASEVKPAAISAQGVNLKGYLWGQPMIVYFGLLIVLFLAKWVSEHPDTKIEPAHLHIGGYNVAMVTLIAILGIDAMKIIVDRFPVPGLYQVVNFA
ncbi:MAG: hypothetical protein QXZ36_03685 [Thermoproteota archaeon]